MFALNMTTELWSYDALCTPTCSAVCCFYVCNRGSFLLSYLKLQRTFYQTHLGTSSVFCFCLIAFLSVI